MRVIGLGQPLGGDDGVGIAVARAVRDASPGLEVHELTGAEHLVDLLDGTPTLLVDALIGAGPPGTLIALPPAALGRVRAFSTHGIGVAEALALAEALSGPEVLDGLVVLGIGIDPPTAVAVGLSPAVAAAVPPAVARVRRWVREGGDARGLAGAGDPGGGAGEGR